MDQTRVTQLLPWRCVLEMGNAKYNRHQSSAYRQWFQGNKNQKRKSDSKETGFFWEDFWMFVGIFGIVEFLIRPTNIQSTQN